MLTIRPCPPYAVPCRLVLWAHSDATESVHRGWAARVDPRTEPLVLRTDRDPERAALTLRDLPLVVPTLHLCAAEAVREAVELARAALAEPDLLLVVDTGAPPALPDPPVRAAVTVLTARPEDGSPAVRTTAWGELTTRAVAFRLLPARREALLTAGSPVPDHLVSFLRALINDTPTQAEV